MHLEYRDEQWSKWFDTLAENDFVVVDDFLPDLLLTEVLRFFKDQETEFRPAKIGQAHLEQRIPEIRSDMTYWLDKQRDQQLQVFFELIEELMDRLKRELFLSLQGYEFHFALYPPGGFYKPHLDQFDARSNRMISFMIYLNPNWRRGDGGELRIHKEERKIDIEPIMNRAVLFRSDTVLHEVLSATKARRSLTGWLLKRPSGVGVLGI